MKIVIADYNPLWPFKFLKERHIIESALKKMNPAVEHIGSTSVYGLAAKPVIDILVGVGDEMQLEQTITPMINAGYVYFEKYNSIMPYRRFFVRLSPIKGSIIPEVINERQNFTNGIDFTSITHIHIVVKDTYHYNRHLAFRDYLKAHPDVRDEYDLLKRSLSQRGFKDSLHYNDAKDGFIKQTEKDALQWIERRNEHKGF